MMHSFSDLVIGDVFAAPSIKYAVTALAIFLAFDRSCICAGSESCSAIPRSRS